MEPTNFILSLFIFALLCRTLFSSTLFSRVAFLSRDILVVRYFVARHFVQRYFVRRCLVTEPSITYGFVPMSFYLQLLLHNFQRRTALQCSPIWLLDTKENQPGNHGMRKQ
jgi:hypothetical protein